MPLKKIKNGEYRVNELGTVKRIGKLWFAFDNCGRQLRVLAYNRWRAAEIFKYSPGLNPDCYNAEYRKLHNI